MTKEERTEYHKIFVQYEKDGYIGEADAGYDGVCTYLPHRPVIKTEAKTTKIRPVFDGSAHQQNKPSINDLLETGPNLNPEILAVLLRFRQNKIAWTADIAQAFLQIGIQHEHDQLIRFLWIEDPDQEPATVKEYRWRRVPFGLSCSPFILRAVILKCLEEHQTIFPELTEQLEHQLYVDDWLGGADNISKVLLLIKQAKELFQSAKMELRKWTTNNSELQSALEHVVKFQQDIVGMASTEAPIKALGLTWNPVTDNLQFDPQRVAEDAQNLNKRPTKRKLFSLALRVFDPLGLISPVALVLLFVRIVVQTWKPVTNN